MRIVEVNMMHTGSTGKIMLEIAETGRQKGHEMWTYSAVGFKDKKDKLPQITNHTFFGISIENLIHHYVAKLTGFQGFFSWFGTHQLIMEIEKVKPELIHLHNLHNRTICLPLLFRYIKRRKLKVVWTLHDCWSFTGQCPHFTMAKCERWKDGCHHCPQIHVYPDAVIDQTKAMWKIKKKWFSGIKNMTLVTPSEWLAKLTQQSFLNEYPVQVINNGINLEIFRPRDNDFRERYGLNEKYILLGVAFDWGERKGLDVFIELANRLDEQYQIVLIGTKENIDKTLPENIIPIHRTQNQTELAEIYSAADLFVNPTREEVMGLVNVEALACGIPVVTFNTGGSPECIDETCGCVVDCDDVDALEREVIRITQEKPFAKEACLARAKSFAMNERFEEYIELYENMSHCT